MLFDCVFVFWAKEVGIGFRMSLGFTGWPWVCHQGGERDQERVRETHIHQNKDIKTVGQSTWLIGGQASACLHPVYAVFHMLITVCYHRQWEVCVFVCECDCVCVYLADFSVYCCLTISSSVFCDF